MSDIAHKLLEAALSTKDPSDLKAAIAEAEKCGLTQDHKYIEAKRSLDMNGRPNVAQLASNLARIGGPGMFRAPPPAKSSADNNEYSSPSSRSNNGPTPAFNYGTMSRQQSTPPASPPLPSQKERCESEDFEQKEHEHRHTNSISISKQDSQSSLNLSSSSAAIVDDDDEDAEELLKRQEEVFRQSSNGNRQILFEGMLKKKSPKGLLKMWQERWFRLYNDCIQYFKDKPQQNKSNEPQGIIPLFMIKSVNQASDKKGFRFDICVGDDKTARVFSLQCKNQQEVDQWVQGIHNAKTELQKDAEAVKFAQAAEKAAQQNPEGAAKFWKDKSRMETIRITAQMDLTQSAKMGATSTPRNPPTLDLKSLQSTPGSSRRELAALAEPIHGVQFLFEAPIGISILGKHRNSSDQYFLIHALRKSTSSQNRDEEADARLDASYLDLMRNCFSIYHRLQFPFITKQIQYGELNDCIFSYFSPAFRSSDSLIAYLATHKRLPEPVVRYFAAELVVALDNIHINHLIFKNLAPENIYVDGDGDVCIFDLLLPLKPIEMPADIAIPEYNTPEGIRGEESIASDWWRLGVLLYELAVGVPPFRTKNENRTETLNAMITSFDPSSLRFPHFVSLSFQSLVRGLLSPDPTHRLGASGISQLQSHEFFSEVDWKAVEQFSVDPDSLHSRQPQWIQANLGKNSSHGNTDFDRAFPQRHMGRLKSKARAYVTLEIAEVFNLALPGQLVEDAANKRKTMEKKESPALYAIVSCFNEVTQSRVVQGVQPANSNPMLTLNNPATYSLNGDKFTFDLGTAEFPPTSDITIEFYYDKQGPENKGLLIGSVQLSLNDIRQQQNYEHKFVIVNASGNKGESLIRATWNQIKRSSNSQRPPSSGGSAFFSTSQSFGSLFSLPLPIRSSSIQEPHSPF